MKVLLASAVFFAAGLGTGYIYWGSDDAPPRTVATAPSEPAPMAVPPRTAERELASAKEAPSVPARPAESGGGAGADAAAAPQPPEASAKKPGGGLDAAIGDMMPLLKHSMESDARERARKLAQELKLPPERAKQLADVMAKHASSGLEVLQKVSDGDETAMTMLGESTFDSDALSPALERDLEGVLTPAEMEGVREHYRKQREESIRQQVESEFDELDLPNLDEPQAAKLREVLRGELEEGGNHGSVMVRAFGEGMDKPQDPNAPEANASDLLVKSMEAAHQARRDKLAPFLSAEQLKRLDEAHARKVEETKAFSKLIGGVAGGKVSGRVVVKTARVGDEKK